MLLRTSAERGALCARMSWATVRDLVEKRTTSPVGVVLAPGDWAGEGVERDVGVGKGEGYARYELSAEGDKDTIAGSDSQRFEVAKYGDRGKSPRRIYRPDRSQASRNGRDIRTGKVTGVFTWRYSAILENASIEA